MIGLWCCLGCRQGFANLGHFIRHLNEFHPRSSHRATR